MNYSPRIRKLGITLGLLFMALLAFVAYRMIWQGQELSRRSYFEQPMQDLIFALAKEGIIQPEADGVSIDLELLRERVKSPAKRVYIAERRRFMYFNGGGFGIDPAAFTVVNPRMTSQAANLTRGRILDRSGEILAETFKLKGGKLDRLYPQGPAALPVVGVAHRIYGTKGLENHLSPYLQGHAEESVFSRLYRFYSAKEEIYDAVLTIDAGLQCKAYEALRDLTGAVVMLEVETGDILAAASTPAFDPATKEAVAWERAAENWYHGPFINRALQKRYPPGSTFKLVTTAALMEQPDFDPKWGIDCKGRHPVYNIREFRNKQHGWVSLKTALTHSCNTFFAEAGVRLGPALYDYAGRFGFNRQWDLLPGDPAEELIAASRAYKGQVGVNHGGVWKPIDFKRNPKLLAQAGVGQNAVEATPLQMAMVAAAIANGGELMAPRLVKEIRYVDAEGGSGEGWMRFKYNKPVSAGRACSQKTASEILELMASVVEKGTGAQLKKIYVNDKGEYEAGYKLPKGGQSLLAGKTGTAETAKEDEDHSWFVAVAPMPRPRYAVAVLIEHGGLGAKTAGPIAVEVMVEVLKKGKG